MCLELIAVGAGAWIAAALSSLAGARCGSRALVVEGALILLAGAILALPYGTATVSLGWTFTAPISFRLAPEASWLLAFGLLPALLAVMLGSPLARGRYWTFGAALTLLGALGVFGLTEGAAFLIAWELMSLGGAIMILSEHGADGQGRATLFMLTLLELGAVCILAAMLWLGSVSGDLAFAHFAAAGQALSPGARFAVGLLFVVGFGAKLGLLPFYEWLPGVYGRASGATGVLLSGVVLNAAYFALSRALVNWLPGGADAGFTLGLTLLGLAVLTAILAILYAFQDDDWRRLLSLSTAENAAIACSALGAALLFRHAGLVALAGLGWLVALLHLAGHALAKGALLLTADGAYGVTGHYRLSPQGLLRRSPRTLALGALLAAMSLAAMPPQIGFVSEWYLFQTMFQGFHLPGIAGPLILSVAGAGLALTVAVAFATFVKVLGVGLLGDGQAKGPGIASGHARTVGLLGVAIPATAVALPWLLAELQQAVAQALPGAGAEALRHDWLLVPLSADFAFISPTKLVIAGPLLALLPLGLWWAARTKRRRAPAWYGGLPRPSERVAITPLAFSNALRTFYSMVYRPTADMRHEHSGRHYFVRRLDFDHRVAPWFGPALFAPAVRLVNRLAAWLQRLQSGSLNLYLAIVGVMLVLILLLPLFR